MKILLINPPNLEEDPLDAQTMPLGLLFIREVLKNRNFDVDSLNLFSNKNWDEVKTHLEEVDYDVVGIPCYTRQRFSVFELAKICKEINEKSIIILGGPHATYLDINILNKFDYINYIIRGEGEFTFLALMNYLVDPKLYSVQDIRGLTFRGDYGIPVRNADRKPIEKLDELPFPKYSYEDLSYFPKCKSLNFHFLKIIDDVNEYMAPILTSRGCDHNCIFCCNGAFWGKQKYHSAMYSFNQIKNFYDKFGITKFDFYDDNFTSSRTHAIELCDLLIENNMNVHWWCSSRAQRIDKTLLLKMKKAGCFMISFGVESGSQKILNNINKGIKIDDVVKTCLLTKQLDLLIRCTISIGHPGENIDTIQETVAILNKLRPDQIGIFFAKMYPGTPLYARGMKEKIIDNEYWFDKNNLPVPFYSSENSLERLLEYRDMILENLDTYVINRYEDKAAYNLEIDLSW